jgi:hypothetical protein
MLSIDTAVPYLVRAGVICEADIADGTIVVDALPRRNNNLCVRMQGGAGYFLKQASELSRSRRSLSREGRFYAERSTQQGLLSANLPEFVLFDPVASVLLLRLLSSHQTLRGHCASVSRTDFPIHLWRSLGELLATVHACVPSEESLANPLAHMIDPSPEILATISPGGLTVFEIAQTATMRRGLEKVAEMWRADTFLHGDLRAENIMVGPSDGAQEVRVVDWELCGLGDPMWDVAACLEMGITLSIGRYVPGDLSIPLIQSMSRQVWQSYRSTREADALCGCTATTKLTMFTASRLVQSAFELSEQVGELSTLAVLCLQIAENIFDDPGGAADKLFALAT